MRLTTRFTPEHLGASTTVIFGFTIQGSDGSLPPPVTSLDIHVPAGMDLATSTLGLETCEPAALVAGGTEACPNNSRLGYGTATVQVPFTTDLVEEAAPVTTLFGPQSGEHLTVLFYAGGRFPIFAPLVFPALVSLDSPPYGEQISTSIPLVPSVPEGPDVSLTSFQATVGPQHLIYYKREHGRTIAFHPKGLAIPHTCPRGGFPFAADFAFQDGSHLTAHSRVTCPAEHPLHAQG